MNGQWSGHSESGQLTLNVDDRGSRFEGVAYFHDADPRLPVLGIRFQTADKDPRFSFRANEFWWFNPQTNGLTREDHTEIYPSAALPKYAEVSGIWTSKSLTITWVTDL